MKKIFAILLTSILCLPAGAQTLVTKSLKPVEQQNFRLEESAFRIGGQICSNSFRLISPDGGLIASREQSYVTYDLKGQYSKLTFVMGPATANPNGWGTSGILVVSTDGKTILDEVIHDYDEVRYITLDVSGAQKVTFKHVKGSQDIGIGVPKLWKAGQNAVVATNPLNNLPKGRIQLVKQHMPYYTRGGGFVKLISDRDDIFWNDRTSSISINRKSFDSGLEMIASDGLIENVGGWSYFWLNKRYDKISFIVGPRDNQSRNVTAWLVVKADGKTIYEEIVSQGDLARQVVLDVAGAEQLSFYCERRSGDMLGSMTFGIVDIFAYTKGDTNIPKEGIVSVNSDKLRALPDVCPLMSNIRPYSVRGFNDAYDTMFYGETKHYTFSMGGYHFWEGMLLTTGNNLMEDMVDSYVDYDLGGEFDWISFDVGCLTKKHELDDDNLRIYADGKLVFDERIFCTWPNQHYEVPVNKCHTLRFAKPGNGRKKQTVIGVADVVLYRGQPVGNDIFVHETPDCPYTIDLIDLCEAPYFHYCGRFVSTITNFSMDDCFHDGSTKREYFNTKDGRQIYKGFLLEANVALGLEEISPMDVLYLFACGAGAAISSSSVAAVTGVSAGAPGGMGALLLCSGEHQSSAAAFNPFGEYESCTFTVENVYEYVDELGKLLGGQSDEVLANPVKLNVFADQRLVGEYWLDNKMDPLTVTVPIFKCKQLMFWLECGDQRSGQYVFHDLKLSKAPCNIPTPEVYTPAVKPVKEQVQEPQQSVSTDSGKKKAKKEKHVRTDEEKQASRAKFNRALGAGLGILDALLN